MTRYTVVTSAPEGYGKAFVDAESDSQALWKAHVAEVLGKSDVVCIIPGEVHPIVPKSRSSAMAATTSDSAATASDAMENQIADRCARLDNGSGAFPYDSFAIAASVVSLVMSLTSIAMSLAVLLRF